jgi:hypothetical protein
MAPRAQTAKTSTKKKRASGSRTVSVEESKNAQEGGQWANAPPAQVALPAQYSNFGSMPGAPPFFPMPMAPQTHTPPGATIINNYYVSYLLPGPPAP